MRCRFVLLLVAATILPCAPARAWNNAGHKIVAMIAFRDLDAATRDRVVAALKEHIAFKNGDWPGRVEAGADADASLFLFAAIFPDDAKHDDRYDEFDVRDAHFINFPFIPRVRDRRDPAIQVKDPHAGQNAVRAYWERVREINGRSTTAETRALALSWVFHLVGDIHQPLHSVARYSPAFPRGDQGGNLVKIHGQKLHSFWDGLLGRNERFTSIRDEAEEIMNEHPRNSLGELDQEFEAWALESLVLAKSTVYQGLDPLVDNHSDFPVGYRASAEKAARRRAAMAGYRLADQLRTMFAP